jgi:hypothetical protein
MTRKALKWSSGALYLLLLGEVYLRLLHPMPRLPRYVSGTSYGVRGNTPNARFWHRTPDYDHEIRINSRGIRADREIPYKKPPGERRVLLLGDSFALGHDATLEETFLYQMRDELASRAGIDVVPINMGVSGFGTAEELITLREEGLRYAPDLVVVAWHSTDLEDNVRSSLFALDRSGRLRQTSDSYLPAVKLRTFLFSFAAYRFLAEHSHLYTWVREHLGTVAQSALAELRGVATRRASPPEGARTDTAPTAQAPAEALAAALLLEMQRIARTAGAEFMVVAIPDDNPEHYSSTFPYSALRGKEPLVVVDLHTAFLAEKPTPVFWRSSHFHLNPHGNRVAGRELARVVIQRGLLQRKR